jgi:DeoR family deoxyribose operon repressor
MDKRNLRITKLINMLRVEESMKISDLSRRLGVSAMTIRRDLDVLRTDHVVSREHGKANLVENIPIPAYENIEHIYNLSTASNTMHAEKKRIAQYAATLVESGDVIILDNGSTTDKIPDFLPNIDMTVVCYNLNIVVKLPQKEKIKIIFGGGYFHPSDQLFESAENIRFLKTIRAHKLFISASGVHPVLGMTCAHDFEVVIKDTVLKSALKKILVADSSKFGAVKTVFFSPMEELDMIITDSGLSPEWVEIIRDKNIELKMV